MDKDTLFDAMCIVMVICVAICAIFTTYMAFQVNKIVDKLDSIEQIDYNAGLIKVNGVLYDEDDYNQMDWRSYTPVKDNIE